MSKIDLTNLFKKNGLNFNSVMVSTNHNTYLPPSEPKTGWLPGIIEIYSNDILSDYKNKDFFIVGSGAAVEAIAICKNFTPNKLFCSDINKEVLPIAKKNVQSNCNIVDSDYYFVKSDLVSYLLERNIKVDIIHENLPNLPFSNQQIVLDGTNSASFYIDKYGNTPNYIIENRLELHYNLLLDSKKVLKQDGAVISCIGGRIDFSIIERMYNDLGYEIELLKIFMVEQLAADTVITGYKTAQEKYDSVTYTFFEYNKGNDFLQQLLNDELDVKNIFRKMFKKGFDAQVAYKKFKLNKKIGHIGLIIKAKQK